MLPIFAERTPERCESALSLMLPSSQMLDQIILERGQSCLNRLVVRRPRLAGQRTCRRTSGPSRTATWPTRSPRRSCWAATSTTAGRRRRWIRLDKAGQVRSYRHIQLERVTFWFCRGARGGGSAKYASSLRRPRSPRPLPPKSASRRPTECCRRTRSKRPSPTADSGG
jgi:hypothetical protein